jgi:hypothetical protein
MDRLNITHSQLFVENAIGLTDGEREFIHANRQHPTVRIFYVSYKRALNLFEDKKVMAELKENLRQMRILIGR